MPQDGKEIHQMKNILKLGDLKLAELYIKTLKTTIDGDDIENIEFEIRRRWLEEQGIDLVAISKDLFVPINGGDWLPAVRQGKAYFGGYLVELVQGRPFKYDGRGSSTPMTEEEINQIEVKA